jgi:hypothetical protein
VTLPPEMLTVTRDDQLSGRQCIVSYLAFWLCDLLDTFPTRGVLDVKGVLVSSCVVVAARGPWMLPILVECSLEV